MAVFALVSASFTNIYMTQPILPVLQDEFGVTPVQVSLTVSAVILGIVLSNLFFGFLSDRFPIHPIILTGGICVAAGGVASALTHDFKILVTARLFQGIFIPALTTSVAAWLARTLPGKRLSVVMGSYISATVLGGLGGRLLGGWIHPPLHWRYAFLSASVFVLVTTIFAVTVLPRTQVKETISKEMESGFISLLKRRDL
ncbi:MAG: MFS transporter, partial [bacterium]|nr:MFS transporter [bacterium]